MAFSTPGLCFLVAVSCVTVCLGQTSPPPPCPIGFGRQNGTCLDIDECSAGASPCHALAVCVNRNGSYACYCKAKTQGDGVQKCVPEPTTAPPGVSGRIDLSTPYILYICAVAAVLLVVANTGFYCSLKRPVTQGYKSYTNWRFYHPELHVNGETIAVRVDQFIDGARIQSGRLTESYRFMGVQTKQLPSLGSSSKFSLPSHSSRKLRQSVDSFFDPGAPDLEYDSGYRNSEPNPDAAFKAAPNNPYEDVVLSAPPTADSRSLGRPAVASSADRPGPVRHSRSMSMRHDSTGPLLAEPQQRQAASFRHQRRDQQQPGGGARSPPPPTIVLGNIAASWSPNASAMRSQTTFLSPSVRSVDADAVSGRQGHSSSGPSSVSSSYPIGDSGVDSASYSCAYDEVTQPASSKIVGWE